MLLRFSKFFKNLYLNHPNLVILAPLILYTLFSKLYDIEARFMFGWDQARDADVLWRMLIEGKPTLIGPQVVSDNAFFLGPLWYYFLAPFYFLFQMDPLGATFSVAFLACVTVTAIFYFFKKIAGLKAAIIGALLWAGISDTLVWNPMAVPLFTVAILLSLFEIIEGKKKFIIWAFLLIGLSLQIHFQMVFFIPLFMFAILMPFIKSKKLPLKEILIGFAVFVLTFLPLILFDIRHDFINSQGFLRLFGIGVDNPQNQTQYLIQLGIVLPKFISSSFFLPFIEINRTIPGSILLVSSILGIALLKTPGNFKLILLSLIILPVFAFSFYKGNLSEYYFIICTIPVLLGFCNLLGIVFKNSVIGKILVTIIVLSICILNINEVLFRKALTGLQSQRQTVKYLKYQKEDQLINISYDVPYNFDAGIKYLLKYYDLKPQDIPEAHLWTVSIPANKEANAVRAIFGDIGIIRR